MDFVTLFFVDRLFNSLYSVKEKTEQAIEEQTFILRNVAIIFLDA